MITLATFDADPQGFVAIQENQEQSDFGTRPGRVSRTALLSGGSFILHRGFDHGDRTFIIRAEDITEGQEAILQHMIETQTSLLLTCRDGAFIGSVAEINAYGGSLDLTFYVKEKVDA